MRWLSRRRSRATAMPRAAPRAVGDAEGVEGTFAAHRKAGETALLAQGVEALPAAGEELVAIRLVPDVPDDEIFRGVEDGVDGEGELDGPETGAQMAALDAHHRDDLLADLRSEFLQLLEGERLEIAGAVDAL